MTLQKKKDRHFAKLFKEYSSVPVLSISTRLICIITASQTGNINRQIFQLCNIDWYISTIWPLFHYLPADTNISEEQWQGYKRANQIFADYIASIAEDDDVIWVHDYHLMLLPEMLRSLLKLKGKVVKLDFFLHIPFPTSEVYRYQRSSVCGVWIYINCRVLPYRREVLVGILNSDLIGFHTYDYARHFLTSCTRILGSNTSPTSVDFNGRTVKVGAYPVVLSRRNSKK